MSIVAISEKPVRTTLTSETDWHEEMRQAIRTPAELCRALQLQPSVVSQAAADSFPVFVPKSLLARIRKGTLDDPILRQILPIDDENRIVTGFTADPLHETAATVTPGLIQKYSQRVLMITTGACAIHCRYCFRREFPYSDAPHSLDQWRPALQQIATDRSIHEVILSGGDPLTAPDEPLGKLVREIDAISHVRRIRIHTRLPVVIPQRVTTDLVDLLSGTRSTAIVVIHVNHVAELDSAVRDAVGTLSDRGVSLLNQSVLLRGVNDTTDALCELFEALADMRVTPYYLHQLDRIRGTAHFEVPISRGIELMKQVRSRLSGYAVPRYVQEIPGEASKVVLV